MTDTKLIDRGEASPASAASAVEAAPERLARIIPGLIIQQQERALKHYASAVKELLIQRPAASDRLSDAAMSALSKAQATAISADELRQAWEQAAH